MRKLASVQMISDKHDIANADAIEVVKVLGGHVVKKRGISDWQSVCLL